MGAFSNMDYELQNSEAAVSDAFTEDDAFVAASRHAEIGLPRLAGAVHHTAHDRDLDGRGFSAQAAFHSLSEADEIDFRAPAGRAGDDFRPTPAQAEGTEQFPRHGHFFFRGGR